MFLNYHFYRSPHTYLAVTFVIIENEALKQQICFSLPDNPTEADFDPDEHSNRSQPRMIPHDEVCHIP